MHYHHHHRVWHRTTTLECSRSASRQEYYHQRRVFVGSRTKRRFFLRSPLLIGCSHSSTTSSDFNPATSIFNDIYRDDETFSKDASRRVAKREAEMKPETYKHPDDSFYGEIDADSMLELIDLGTEGTFMGEGLRYVDLGCGVGKQVATAALSGKFVKADGVEICPDLAAKAIEGVEKLRKKMEKYSDTCNACEISISQGDIFDQDLSQFDFIFFHATTFTDGTLEMVKAKLSREMKVGARLAIVSKRCDDIDNFEPLNTVPGGIGWKPISQVDEKWQLDCYLYQKTEEID